MYKVVTLLLFSRIPNEITSLRACAPNTQFVVNGRLCFCDNRGYLNEDNCKTIRRHSCQPGQIIWNDCNQCICQENGYLLCNNSPCSDNSVKSPLKQSSIAFGTRCIPFKKYYINCRVCVCPPSGLAKDAQCVTDITCNTQTYLSDAITKETYCIRSNMHLSPCMQCLCSDRGMYDANNCADVCGSSTLNTSTRRCTPGILFRIGCDLCRCPNNGIPDKRLCTSAICTQLSLQPSLPTLRTNTKKCVPLSFTAPRCMYCDCNDVGAVNENICLELDCAKMRELSKYKSDKDICGPGEMMPICIECFCFHNSRTISKYCSRECSYENKLNVLEKILMGTDLNMSNVELIRIEKISNNNRCTPNFLYIYDGKYCLCPENETLDAKYCRSIMEKQKTQENRDVSKIEMDFSVPCDPNTFVEFKCNTCYCNKSGIIDPKWCTYDDCEARRVIQESYKNHIPNAVVDPATGTCRPGSVLQLECNFCICPESGILKEKACTQNDCTEIEQSIQNDKVSCEPLTYYKVDCNICYCPRDGIKNVAKCTKDQCEKNLLRSDSCIPGQLFCVDCNVCICPPDGNKMGKACTNHICHKPPSWELFELSDILQDNYAPVNESRSLDQCVPGEEFAEGCDLCICPELGLKIYATCESILCDDKINILNSSSDFLSTTSIKKTQIINYNTRSRRTANDCFSYNVSHSAERKECTPGTLYIIRCKQCICPYLGNINNFCRPLPKNMYCEKAFPYFNYLPMGRREIKVNATNPSHNHARSKHIKLKENIEIKVKHEHTKYYCTKPGTIVDRCFICDCEESNTVIEEHCFRSDADNCTDAKPTFLFQNKVVL